MPDYRIITRSPCRITLNNKVRTFRANDSFIANEQEKDRLMRSMYRSKLVVVQKINDSATYETTSKAEPKEEPKAEPKEESSDQQKEEVLNQESSESHEETANDRLAKKGLPQVSIPQNTHWATVRSKVQDLENMIPIPLEKIKAIREKFKDYVKVVEECDRILEENQ